MDSGISQVETAKQQMSSMIGFDPSNLGHGALQKMILCKFYPNGSLMSATLRRKSQ